MVEVRKKDVEEKREKKIEASEVKVGAGRGDWESMTVEGYRSGRVKYPSDGQFSGKAKKERGKIARASSEENGV